MQHYTLSLLSVVLIFSVTGSTGIENELLKAGLKQFSQFTPPIWVEPDTSRIQFAQIEPAGTPLDGELTITIHVAKLSDRRVEISGTTNLPVDTPLLLSVLELGPGGFYGMKTCTVLGDGFYKCEVLGNRELKEGVYVVRFLMATPGVQLDDVEKHIRENNAMLTNSEVTVLIEKEFTVSGAQTQQEPVNDLVQEYNKWLKLVMALHAELQAALGSFGSAQWDQFAREFREENMTILDYLIQTQPKNVQPIIVAPIEDVWHMFRATESGKSQDYIEANAEYLKHLKQLEQFIAEAKSTQ